MAGTGGKGGKPPKPFLGDDLLGELDAWDATFDALHGTEEPPAMADVGAQPAAPDPHAASTFAWPAANTEPSVSPDPDPTSLTPIHAIDDNGVELDDQLTLDGADVLDAVADDGGGTLDAGTMDISLEAGDGNETIDRDLGVALPARPRLETHAPAAAETVVGVAAFQAPAEDPMETDFSDIGLEGEAEAAGGMLGADTKIAPAPTRPGALPRAKTPLPLLADEEEVFTSASRPRAPAAPDDDELRFDDDVAPPPAPPAPSEPPSYTRSITGQDMPPVSARTRTGPAIIRRALPDLSRRDLPATNDASMFNEESTRVSSIHEIEAKRAESLRPQQRVDTAVPIGGGDVEDDYEVEIDQASQAATHDAAPSSGTPSGPPPAEQSRRIAHVVRRADQQTTKPPPNRPSEPAMMPPRLTRAKTLQPPDNDDDHVIEMDIGDDDDEPMAVTTGELPPIPLKGTPVLGRPSAAAFGAITPAARPTTGSGAEDDFSDVAASFDAEPLVEDIVPPPIAPPPPSAPIPVVPSRSGQHVVQRVRDPKPTAQPLGPPPSLAIPTISTANEPAKLEDALSGLELDGDDAAATRAEAKPLPGFSDFSEGEAPRTTIGTAPPPIAVPSIPTISPRALADAIPRVKTPTSVPPLGLVEKMLPTKTLAGISVPTAAQVAAAKPGAVPTLEAPAPATPDVDPALDLDTIGRTWPEEAPAIAAASLEGEHAEQLLVYEREIETVDDPARSAALRIEAARLSERLADADRARGHYDAALLADPRATTALRGLRRIARGNGDLAEATRHLEAEIAVAGGLERRPLGHYRVDLLMASGEQDLARVAVGEILDSAPSDVRALLAQLELAFLDGRADEFGSALEQLAHAVTDAELRAAVQSARGVLAAHHNDTAAAANFFTAAAESDPASLAARLGAIRQAAAAADGEAAARALVELARNLEASDPTTAAAAAIRAQQWAIGEVAIVAAQLALDGAPNDPLVARLAADTTLATYHAIEAAKLPDSAEKEHLDEYAKGLAEARAVAGQAFARWAKVATANSEKAYAAARAAELDPASGVALWSQALALDPGDDYAAAQLRTAHVAEEAVQASIDVDLAVANDPERDRARLRAAYGLIALGRLDDAIATLSAGRTARPQSLALAEALGEALAAAGKWSERAQLFAELADEAQRGSIAQLDRDVAVLRSALAWEEAVGAHAEAATSDAPPDEPTKKAALTAALDTWARVLEHAPTSPAAHAASLLLAKRLGDRDILADALARTQAATLSPWAVQSLALERARLVGDPDVVDQILRDAAQLQSPPLDDPRRSLALVLAAARKKDLDAAAQLLDERVASLPDNPTEAAMLRLRAAQLALDAGDAVRATMLLGKVEQALPYLGVVPDLLAAARRRSGDRPLPSVASRRSQAPTSMGATGDEFARIVRDADLALAHDDGAGALALYQRALEVRPGDPLAAVPMIRVATQLRQPAPVADLALAQLKAAETAGDALAKATAYELLARIDADLRSDPGSAQISLESASQADPGRVDLLHRLERSYAEGDQLAELSRLRAAELDTIPPELVKDRAAILVDLAGLAARDRRPEGEVADHYRAALAADPKTRLALMHLEAIVRRAGFSPELADLEQKISDYFATDAKAAATFCTRSGETLAEIGQIDTAVQRFGVAESLLPGHVPALEGWRHAALKGQLWIDVAAAATRQAQLATDPKQQAILHHFAGVALMDKALAGDQAMKPFHAAIEADPSHRDAFLRLRILLEEDGNHDDLAVLLAKRLAFETEGHAKMELHRALAELCRNFLSDRDGARLHFRAILEIDPNDLRAHSALADIAWELGAWQDAADALVARARLEKSPDILKTLCFRLGLIYADYLVDVPMALKAFQRALTYSPDDEQTLIRLADLATQAGEWKLALGACERLVKQEDDPDKRASHLHRVAKIFKTGFNDAKRAERALNLALDGAPTNDDALQMLVQFYKEQNDITSVRVHLNRVAGTMRARVAANPIDGVAYRVISRTMSARAQTGVPGSLPIARAAAELAGLLGAAGEPEKTLQNQPPRPEIAPLVKAEADEVLFPKSMQPELRQLFGMLGDRVAKHVGVSLQPYGVARGDRQRAKDSTTAQVAQSVATALGFGEIDVYVSAKQPWVMVAEMTSPVSLVLGSTISESGGDAIRFAAGAALKLAQTSLAIPARLASDELGVLVIALLRLFQADFPSGKGIDAEAVTAQVQKLKRLIPNNLMNELRPFGLAIDGQRFSHEQLARDLKVAGLRAGLVASGSLVTGLKILAAQAGGALPDFLTDPVAQGLVTFALGEDHAVVAR